MDVQLRKMFFFFFGVDGFEALYTLKRSFLYGLMFFFHHLLRCLSRSWELDFLEINGILTR